MSEGLQGGKPHDGAGNSDQSKHKVSALGQDRKQAVIAVDLGAESCRVSLLRWSRGNPDIQLVHRFPNGPIREGDTLRWDIRRICDGVRKGIEACAALAPEGIAAIGVDGWAVDYVRLSPNGEPVANPFCYRDERNIEALRHVHQRIPAKRLYELTGAQIITINTLYQLYADSRDLEQNVPWQNLPEYLLSHLGGRQVSEYTNATHTQLLDVTSHELVPRDFHRYRLGPEGSATGRGPGNSCRPTERAAVLAACAACYQADCARLSRHGFGDRWNSRPRRRLGIHQFGHVVAGRRGAALGLCKRGRAKRKLQ